MYRTEPHVERSLGMRIASLAGAAAFSAAILGTLVTAMAPSGQDAAFSAATEVTIVPSRIEVVGARATSTARAARTAAAPHVG
ncbi:MAG TPA: hypothetical protein VFX05_01030 [Casimicrobiaceae bacterium]|jgi:hypothetical protein|nr:hypothetical protein [Casimicrobiaceae bacterium]